MVPCAWLTEVAAYAKAHPDADLGLHLTLTSEWRSYRWGPVASRNEVPGLLGPDGNLWPDVPFVTKHATAAEVEKEIRAQVELAMKVGIRPTHLDSHMGTLFDPAYFPGYVKVAREYGLPFLAMRTPGAPASMLALLKDSDILPDAIAMATNGTKPENWASYYLGLIRIAQAGADGADRPPGLRRCRDAGHHRRSPGLRQRLAAARFRRDHQPRVPAGAQRQSSDPGRLEAGAGPEVAISFWEIPDGKLFLTNGGRSACRWFGHSR
jgi:hypothetical protein